MKTSELTGAALDWAVGKAIGEYKPVAVPHYSIDWAQGGPIIEREDTPYYIYKMSNNEQVWCAEDKDSKHIYSGPTPLIAAMRCYVASKLGEEVEVPDELH
jgi:hypothetical protein